MHNGSGRVQSRCGRGQPARSAVVVGQADRVQGPQGRRVATMRRGGGRRGQSQGVGMVVEGEVREVGRDEGVRQAGGGRGAAHQERPQRVDEGVRPWQGVSLAFVLHPPVLEPNLREARPGDGEELVGKGSKETCCLFLMIIVRGFKSGYMDVERRNSSF